MTVLVVILVLALLGSAPVWPYSREWGPWPGGLLGVAFLVLLVLYLLGYRV